MTIYEIPLSTGNQSFTVALGGSDYRLTLVYRDADDGAAWLLDIADTSGTVIVSGIPLVTGADLLAQYKHLGIGGQLFVQTDGDPEAVPTYASLGATAGLYWIPD